jgi:hypothetical protein
MNYVDHLMVNREPSQKIKGSSSIDTDYYNSNCDASTDMSITDNYSEIKGGNIADKPRGGFPLLFQLEKEDNTDTLFSESEIAKREQALSIKNINIGDIMSKRREIKPFFEM